MAAFIKYSQIDHVIISQYQQAWPVESRQRRLVCSAANTGRSQYRLAV